MGGVVSACYHHVYSLAPTRRRFLPLAMFWARRVQTCLLFFLPVLAFILIAHRVQHSHFSAFYARRV